MIRRLRKQITYATGALLAIVAVIVLVGLFNNPRGSNNQNNPTPTPTFLPIAVTHTYVITRSGVNGTDTFVDVVGELMNSNPNAGIASLSVTIALKDPSGQEITRMSKETYILPGGLQYVMAFDIPLEHRVLGQVEVTTDKQAVFVALPASVRLPEFSAFAKEHSEKTIGSKTVDEERGIVKNTSTFDWGKVEVYVLALTKENTVVAAGQTFVGALTVGEEREFIVTWPHVAESIDRFIVLPATNMYREDNLIQAVGNPTLLR